MKTQLNFQDADAFYEQLLDAHELDWLTHLRNAAKREWNWSRGFVEMMERPKPPASEHPRHRQDDARRDDGDSEIALVNRPRARGRDRRRDADAGQPRTALDNSIAEDA